MIGRITGRAEDAGKGVVIIETGGGVGYTIHISAATKNTILAEGCCTLFTHTVIRKETIELFGFIDQEEYATFLLLLSVSGIGTKKALATLASAPSATLLSAIKNENIEMMVSLGIGKKQAQRIVLDLQQKIEVAEDVKNLSGDVVTALIALGYDRKEIAETLKNTKLSGGSVEKQIQEALRAMRNGGIAT